MAKILCIDDEPHVVTLKCAILEAAGHEVTPATSAHEAIQMLSTNTYDAVVTDWRWATLMAARWCKRQNHTRPCPWLLFQGT